MLVAAGALIWLALKTPASSLPGPAQAPLVLDQLMVTYGLEKPDMFDQKIVELGQMIGDLNQAMMADPLAEPSAVEDTFVRDLQQMEQQLLAPPPGIQW